MKRDAQHDLCLSSFLRKGLVGLELTGRTFGIVGTGAIGLELVKLLRVSLLRGDLTHPEQCMLA